jgi:hypothetical protein
MCRSVPAGAAAAIALMGHDHGPLRWLFGAMARPGPLGTVQPMQRLAFVLLISTAALSARAELPGRIERGFVPSILFQETS